MKFLKAIFILGLLIMVGFLIFKQIDWKPGPSQADLKRKYTISCKRLLEINISLDESFEETADIPDVNYIYELRDLVKRYASNIVLKDAWGNDFLFRVGSMGNYYVASSGSDGIFQGFNQRGEYKEFNGQDIIMERVSWLFNPKNPPPFMH